MPPASERSRKSFRSGRIRATPVLFISPKTASVHVSAILAKLGAGTRGEAAALHRANTGQSG